jgi:hypothetical protein
MKRLNIVHEKESNFLGSDNSALINLLDDLED